MRPISRWTSLAGLAVGVALAATACTSAAATPTSAVGAATSTPATAGPAAGSATAAAGITIGSTADPALGAYLTGQNGMTLYVRTSDKPDSSTCSGSCATTWPPLTVSPGATITGPVGATQPFATFTRADGTTQVSYNHMPLYYYSGDSKAGDTTGEGLGGVWFVAPLSGTLATAAPAATASTGSGY